MQATITAQIVETEISSDKGKTTYARALGYFLGQAVLLEAYGQKKANALYEGVNKTFNLTVEGLNGSATSQKIMSFNIIDIEEISVTPVVDEKEEINNQTKEALESVRALYQQLLDNPKKVTKAKIQKELEQICS